MTSQSTQKYVSFLVTLLLFSCIVALTTPPCIAQAAGEMPITSLALTIDPPVAGAPTGYNGGYHPLPETEQYTISYAWYEGENSAQWATGTFKAGVTYCISFHITPQPGYMIDETSLPNITVNGEVLNGAAWGSSPLKVKHNFHIPGAMYTINFDANGGTGTMASVSVEENNAYTLPACEFSAPDGYQFTKWIVGDTEYDAGAKITVTGPVVVKPKWITVQAYTVTFQNNGRGTTPDDQVVSYNSLVTEPAMDAVPGYIFGGWYADPSFTTKWNFATDRVQDDTVLYGLWNRIITSLALTIDPPVAGAPTGYNGGYHPLPETEQYTISYAWYEGENSAQWATGTFKAGVTYCISFHITPQPGYMIDETSLPNITVNGEVLNGAAWGSSPLKVKHNFEAGYRIVFMSNGGSAVADQIVMDGGKVTRPSSPVRAGYLFAGWFKDETLTSPYDFEAPVSANQTIYAKWTPIINIASATVTGLSAKTYSGAVQTLTPTVIINGKVLVNGTDYILAYANNKYVGRATITIVGKGAYRGTLTKTFNIIPKPTAIRRLTSARRALTASWKKMTVQTSGYQVKVCRSKRFLKGVKTVTIAKRSVLTKKFTRLKARTRYYVKVRTFRTVNGVKYFSRWSRIKYTTTR